MISLFGPVPRIVPFDSDDDAIVHTALIGRADILCTLNRHLYRRSVTDYCTSHRIRIASDLETLALLRSPNKGTAW